MAHIQSILVNVECTFENNCKVWCSVIPVSPRWLTVQFICIIYIFTEFWGWGGGSSGSVNCWKRGLYFMYFEALLFRHMDTYNCYVFLAS